MITNARGRNIHGPFRQQPYTGRFVREIVSNVPGELRQPRIMSAKIFPISNHKKTISMKRFMMMTAVLLTIGTTETIFAQTEPEEKKTRAQIKAEQEALDQLYFEEALQSIEEKKFVLEADQVVFKDGTIAFVTPTTNFVAVNEDQATVQVAFNIPASGPNGLGGVTVTGRSSNYKKSVDKRGNIMLSMDVLGNGISAQVYINLPKGTNRATVTIAPNFNSNRFTLNGVLLPLRKANVYKGTSL